MYYPIGLGGFTSSYWLVFFVIPLFLGILASSSANSRLQKYAKVSNSVKLTGIQAAQQMLNFHKVLDVATYAGANGQDFFNPKDKSISLSQNYASSPSVTALAVACHEAGHACQYNENYWPIKFRNALVPALNIASRAWIFILLAGIFFRITGLTYIGIIVFSLTLIFHLITLPVEFNASKRAIVYLNTLSLSEEEMRACKSILRSCAMTYVVAALISALQLIWILLGSRRN